MECVTTSAPSGFKDVFPARLDAKTNGHSSEKMQKSRDSGGLNRGGRTREKNLTFSHTAQGPWPTGWRRRGQIPGAFSSDLVYCFPALLLTPNFLPSVNSIFVRTRHVNSAEVQLQGQQTRKKNPGFVFGGCLLTLTPPEGESMWRQKRNSVLQQNVLEVTPTSLFF